MLARDDEDFRYALRKVFPSVHTGAVEPSNRMRKPARIGIQGRIEYHRRDYKKIFKDLLHAIQGELQE